MMLIIQKVVPEEVVLLTLDWIIHSKIEYW